jgi:hypothetical protein
MTKNSFACFFLLFIPIAIYAQSADKLAISIGANAVFPFNTSFGSVRSNQVYRDGYGLFAQAELPLPDHFALTFSAGYVAYAAKPTTTYTPSGVYFTCLGCTIPTVAITTNNPNDEYIPVKAALRYYLSSFYIEAEAGTAIKAGGKASTSALYAGGVGWLIRFNRHSAIDLGAYFERAFTSTDYNYLLSQADIRLAYRFAF